MTDEQIPEQQPGGDAAVDPVQAAYEAALRGGDSDPFGHELPAREVTSIGGRPIDAVEREARANLDAIERMRGRSGGQPESPSPSPEQPAQEQAAEAPQPGELSPEQVAERLLYGPEEPYGPEEHLSPEQAAAFKAMQAAREFHSGEAAQAAVEAEGQYEREHEELLKLPGITTPAFMEYAEAPWARMIDAYEVDPESVASLDVLRQFYEQSGGAQRWSEEAEAQEQEHAYEKALSGGGPRDSWGFPIEERQ